MNEKDQQQPYISSPQCVIHGWRIGARERGKFGERTGGRFVNRECKHDVYGRRQTAKITSDFLFFSCNLETNHTKMEKCLLIFAANTNVLIPLYRELKADGEGFIFAVCRLP